MVDRFNFQEFPDYYRSLSLRLCPVLEDAGASTALRDEIVKVRTALEILHTSIGWLNEEEGTITKGRFSSYCVGSDFEGTTIPGLKSDSDSLIVFEETPVVIDIPDAQQYQHCYLMVRDSSTPAGYFKLQYVINGEPQFVSLSSSQPVYEHTDKKGRGVLAAYFGNAIRGSVTHGPAETVTETPTAQAQDLVSALRCRTVPDCASEWFSRQRHCKWPTTDCIDKCKTLSCFFVQVGHPYSEERCLEWRLSFSLQERLLVTSFYSVQLKCFILLKIIKKEVIKKALGEDGLTSYHCKTCMLYMVENTPAEFWREDNLLHCLYSCLNMIERWVATGVCPNYFIPDENMFDGKIFGRIRIRLHEILSTVLAADFKFLAQIRTGAIGQRFQGAINFEVHSHRNLSFNMAILNGNYISLMFNILWLRILCLQWCQQRHIDLSATCKRLNEITSELERTEITIGHTHEETRNAVSLLVPYVKINLMSVLTVLAHQSRGSNEYIFQLLTSEKWHTVSLEYDSFSSKLKQASLLYMLGFNEISLDILSNLERNLKHHLGICFCSEKHRSKVIREDLLSINASSVRESLGCFVPCVAFLSAESELMPHALCYELNGFVEVVPNEEERCFTLAVVDGKILLYLLLYLNHRHFDMEANAASDINNIRWLIRDDRHLGHKTVAFNILGWIYKEKGFVREARECFQESLQLQPGYNAAFQHLRALENLS